MNDSENAKRIISSHCNDLAELASLLMRSAAGGTGAEKISSALVKAVQSLDELESAIERREVVDFGLCQRIAADLKVKAFPHEYGSFDALLDGGVQAGMRVGAHRLGNAMCAHISRAERDLRDWVKYYAHDVEHHLKRGK